MEDTRTALASPVVTFDKDYFLLTWEAVENASYYNVYNATTGELVHEWLGETQCSITIGNQYIVKAIPSDYQSYSASQSAVIDTEIKLDAPAIEIDETGAVTFGTYKVGGRVTYTYVINDGEEQTTTKASTGITLNEGDIIKVKASCKNVGYTDSDWATATYTANA